MSPGKELNLGNRFLTQTFTINYKEFCKLDVLGLKDKPTLDQEIVYKEFKEQLTRNLKCRYETGVPWKGKLPLLPVNCMGDMKCLESPV